MRRKRSHFRITKKGRIIFLLLTAAFIFAVTYVFRMHNQVALSSIKPESPSADASTEIKKQDDKTNDSADLEDDSLSSSGKPQNHESTTTTNNNTNTTTNTNAGGKSDPEIDEKFFNKSLFVGDSITEGISAYGLLSNTNVLAVKGLTVLKAEKEIGTIAKRKPERIYILLGSNDLLYGMDSEKFSSEYVEFIRHIKDKLPGAKIYIQSIFPVSKDVERKKPLLSNSRIDEFNKALSKMAEEQDIGYIDVSSLLKDSNGIMNKDYTSDGIHVKYKFYSIWLDCVKRNS